MPHGAIYVDRTSKWGNPFIPGVHGSRAECIEQYRRHLWEMLKSGRVSVEELADLHGRDLICHCKPKPCHADVIERAAAWACRRLND